MRHVRDDGDVRGTLGSALRRRTALVAGVAGVAFGAAIAGGAIAPADHSGQSLATGSFREGGGPPPPPAPPPPPPPGEAAGAPAPDAPSEGQVGTPAEPGAPGAPAP